jgi:peptidoglycan/LPS O-acetylase OafA/YrhL
MNASSSMSASAASPHRLPGVDALRGLSILLVVLHHVGLRIPLDRSPLVAGWPEPLVQMITGRGYEAVFIFFAVSGFLIASHTLQRWGSLAAIDVRAFYRRRAARILPCLLLLVAVLAALALLRVPHYAIERSDQSIGRAVVAALGFRINWYEARTGYLPASWDVLWSLSVEEAFYLGFPLLCLALGRSRVLMPALLALALSLPWLRAALHGQGLWVEKADGPGMAAIACGIVAALVAHRWPAPPPRLLRNALGALGIAGLVVAGPFEEALWHLVHNGFLLVVAASAALLCLVSAWNARARPLRSTPPPRFGAGATIRSFGRLSYEIYLTHIFAMWWVVDAFEAAGRPVSWIVWAYAAAFGLAWLLGWALATLWSTPMLHRLSRTKPSTRSDAVAFGVRHAD